MSPRDQREFRGANRRCGDRGVERGGSPAHPPTAGERFAATSGHVLQVSERRACFVDARMLEVVRRSDPPAQRQAYGMRL